MARTHSLGRSLLRSHLKRTEMRHADLAKLAGVTPQVVSHWCTGQRRPNRENAAKLEDALGIPVRAWAKLVPRPRASVPAAISSTPPELA